MIREMEDRFGGRPDRERVQQAMVRLIPPAVPAGSEITLIFNGEVDWDQVRRQVAELQATADKQLVHDFLRRADEWLEREFPEEPEREG